MTALVGIIANPASGKDIRRLVAHGSVFSNNEKINIITRVLRGLDALGIRHVLAMPDSFGLAVRAYENAGVSLRMTLLDMAVTNTSQDSTQAARMMVNAGVKCIVTLGGDGTNRAVAKGCGSVPLVPVSTGTNNVFPKMVEGTLAGFAAAVVSLEVEGVRESAIRPVPRLEILREGKLTDIALVDTVVYDERFVASRAIWDTSKICTVILPRVRTGTIGASSIAGNLPEAHLHNEHGAWLEVALGGDAIYSVLAPIAPGLMASVPIQSVRWLSMGEEGTVACSPAILALDGEREVPIVSGEKIRVRLSQEGPNVVDIGAALRAASQAGLFVSIN